MARSPKQETDVVDIQQFVAIAGAPLNELSSKRIVALTGELNKMYVIKLNC